MFSWKLENMEGPSRRLGVDKENKHVKLKSNLAWPDKRQDFVVRGPLGELNTNIPIQRKLAGRVAVIIAEFENKAAQNRVASQSTVIQPSSHPPLRCEESTAHLAARATAHTLAVKENKAQIKQLCKEPRQSLENIKLVETDFNESLEESGEPEPNKSSTSGRYNFNLSSSSGQAEPNESSTSGNYNFNLGSSSGEPEPNESSTSGNYNFNLGSSSGEPEPNESSTSGNYNFNLGSSSGEPEPNESSTSGNYNFNLGSSSGEPEPNESSTSGNYNFNLGSSSGEPEPNESSTSGNYNFNLGSSSGEPEPNESSTSGKKYFNLSSASGEAEPNESSTSGKYYFNLSSSSGEAEPNESPTSGKYNFNLSSSSGEPEPNESSTSGKYVNLRSSSGEPEPNESPTSGKYVNLSSSGEPEPNESSTSGKYVNLSSSSGECDISIEEDIENVDAEDKTKLSLLSIYDEEIFKYLFFLEHKYSIESDHLRKQTVVTEIMRAKLIDWLVDVQLELQLSLETLHLTVGTIDRYLQAVSDVQSGKFQLVGVTAMFLASKYEEIYSPSVTDFLNMIKNRYTKADVFQCEWDILTKLGFCLARPIPLSFLKRFLGVCNWSSKQYHLAQYLVELALVEYSMAHYHPSELSAGATCLSLFLLSGKTMEEIWTDTLRHYTGYSLQHIDPIVRRLARIVINVKNSNWKAVYNKYLQTNLAKVSSLPQLEGEAINELASTSSPPFSS